MPPTRLPQLALLLWAATSCADGAVSSAGAEVSAVRSVETMADALAASQGAFLGAVELLELGGYVPRFGAQTITTCEDSGRESQPHAYGRLDDPDGAFSTTADVQAILDGLVAQGWEPLRDGRFTDGVSEAGDRWIVAVGDGDVSLRVGLWSNRDYVLVDSLGTCLPNTEEERKLYGALASWGLDAAIGAAEPVEPVSVDVVPASDGSEGDPPALSRMVSDANRHFRDTVDLFASWGMTQRFGHLQVPECGDGGGSQPRVSALLDQQDGRASVLLDAVRVRDQLAASGWEPWSDDGIVDGVSEAGGGWVVVARRYDLTMEVAMWPDRSAVVVEVSGPCVPSTTDERALFAVLGAAERPDVFAPPEPERGSAHRPPVNAYPIDPERGRAPADDLTHAP